MHTDSWTPPRPASRASWSAAFGWYFAGVLASLTGWSTLGVFGRVVPVLGSLATVAMGSAVAVLLVGRNQSMPRRSRVAFVLGIATPFVVIAIAFACLAYAFAHSDWQF